MALVCLTPLPCGAVFEERPLSARSAALGESLAAAEGTESATVNPAALGFFKGMEFRAGQSRLLGLAEFPHRTALCAFSTSHRAAMAVTADILGTDLYREQSVGVGAGFSLGDLLALGAAVRRADVHISRYGSAGAWAFDAGILGRVRPNLSLGAAAINLNHPRLGNSDEGPLPLWRGGLAWKPFPSLLTLVEAVKTPGDPYSWRVGQEAAVGSVLFLRAGFETVPSRWGAGLGARVKGMGVDYGFLTHPYLPEEHRFDVSWRWEARGK
jgi:hypothetical protein